MYTNNINKKIYLNKNKSDLYKINLIYIYLKKS